MADDNAGGTGGDGAGAGNAPQIPEGQTLVSKADLEAMQARLAGFQEAGFETPDQVKPWAGVLSTAAKANLTPEQLSKLLAGEGKAEEPKPGDDKPLTARELQSMLDAREGKINRSMAEQTHQQAIIQQARELQKLAEEAIGDSLTGNLKSIAIEGVLSQYDTMRSKLAYPIGHPLHGEFNPALPADKIQELVAKVKVGKDEQAAKRMAQIAGAGANARGNGQPYSPQSSGQGDFSRLSQTDRIKAEILAKQAAGVRG